MVGWTHAIAPEILWGGIRILVINNLDTGGILLTDTVSGEGYPHRHSPIALFEGSLAALKNSDPTSTLANVFVHQIPCGRSEWKVTKELEISKGRR